MSERGYIREGERISDERLCALDAPHLPGTIWSGVISECLQRGRDLAAAQAECERLRFALLVKQTTQDSLPILPSLESEGFAGLPEKHQPSNLPHSPDRLATLRARVAELEQDKERLDWIEAQPAMLQPGGKLSDPPSWLVLWWKSWNSEDILTCGHEAVRGTLREAIDAARSAKG